MNSPAKGTNEGVAIGERSLIMLLVPSIAGISRRGEGYGLGIGQGLEEAEFRPQVPTTQRRGIRRCVSIGKHQSTTAFDTNCLPCGFGVCTFPHRTITTAATVLCAALDVAEMPKGLVGLVGKGALKSGPLVLVVFAAV